MKSLRSFKNGLQAVPSSAARAPRGHRTRIPCILASHEHSTTELLLERQILNPERAETSSSGTDDEVARHRSSYDPSTTTPESEVLALEAEYKLEGDARAPLLVSPANRAVSLILDPMVGGAVQNAQALGSVKGWTNKHKKVLLRTAPYQFKTYESIAWELRKRPRKLGEGVQAAAGKSS